MHEELVTLILRLKERLEECAQPGAHPHPAERAAWEAQQKAFGCMWFAVGPREWFVELDKIHTTCKSAVRDFPVYPENVPYTLRGALKQLKPLVKLAQEARACEESFA